MCGPDQAPGQFRYDLAASGRPGSVSEALAALHGALGFLADADATALTASEQAECLRGLERAESARIAARSSVLAAFTANGVFADDGHRGPTSWLRWQTRITGSAAAGAVAWMRRLSAHPAVRDALAGGSISAS